MRCALVKEMLAADHQGCAFSFRTGDLFHTRKVPARHLPSTTKQRFWDYFWRALYCCLLRYSILATITYCSTLQFFLFVLLPNHHAPIPIHSMAVLRPTLFSNHCAKPPFHHLLDACIWIPTLQNRFYELPCVPFSASRTSSLITLCNLDILKCILRPIGSSHIIQLQPDGPWRGCASRSDHLCIKGCAMVRASNCPA
jgi:hypothetical protein